MSKKAPSVLITLDSMKDPNTGLYYFGKALFTSILKESNNKFNFSFYVKGGTNFFKNKKLGLYRFFKMHRYFFPYYNRFDLVHITDQFCRLPPARVNGKKILTVHDLNFLHQPGMPPDVIQQETKLLASHIKHCDAVVAISNFVAGDIRKAFPDEAAKVCVIYNGADKLSVPDNYVPAYVPQKPFIFTLGPINEKKNFHVLPALLQNNDYELIISGIVPDIDYPKQVWAQAEQHGCTDRMTLTGEITDSDKAWYYKNCLAFAFPSLAEGFGLPVIEAMGFGKPVFLSNKTSLPEIGGDVAFYFDSFAAGDMQQTFESGMRRYASGNMQDIIKQRAANFTWEKAARNYVNLYTSLLAGEKS